MGLDPQNLPDNIKEKLPAEEKKRLGKAGQTLQERIAKRSAKSERDEQRTFASLLSLKRDRGELLYDWSRTDKRTTNRTGRADFWIMAGGKGIQIEFKLPGGKLSKEQTEERDIAEAAAVPYHVVSDADQAFRIVSRWLIRGLIDQLPK